MRPMDGEWTRFRFLENFSSSRSCTMKTSVFVIFLLLAVVVDTPLQHDYPGKKFDDKCGIKLSVTMVLYSAGSSPRCGPARNH